MDSVLRDLGNTALGLSVYRNPAYYVRGTKIGFIPKPTEAGATAIAIWYIKIVSELSADSDEIDIPFPDRYYESIALEAAANLLRKGQQEEVVARQYLVEAKQLREDMQIELEDRISDDSKSIVDTVGEDLDFSTPM